MQENKLFKVFNVFWEPVVRSRGDEFIGDYPFCSNDSCRTLLDQATFGTDNTGAYVRGWKCCNCDKKYPCPENNYQHAIEKVRKIYEGHKRLDYKVYSLELPPTQVKDDAEDENYWVQARISEKNGKRMAVIYFGQRLKGEQSKKDYVQIFLDFEDEQLRFDKTNKNPMRLLAKLTGEFPSSIISLESRNETS